MFPKVLQTLVKYYNKPVEVSLPISEISFERKFILYDKGEEVEVGFIRRYYHDYHDYNILYSRTVRSIGRRYAFTESISPHDESDNSIDQGLFDDFNNVIIPSTFKRFFVPKSPGDDAFPSE